MDSMLGSWRFDVARSPGVLELYEDAGFPKEFCTEEAFSSIIVSAEKDGANFTYSMVVPGLPVKSNICTLGQPFEIESFMGQTLKGKITEKEGNVEIYVNDADSDEVTTLQKLNGNEIKAVSTSRGKSVTIYLVKV